MKTVVFCGSPKGVNSITLQTVRYLSVKFPEDEFSLFDVSAASSVTDEGMRKIAAALEDAADEINTRNSLGFGLGHGGLERVYFNFHGTDDADLYVVIHVYLLGCVCYDGMCLRGNFV